MLHSLAHTMWPPLCLCHVLSEAVLSCAVFSLAGMDWSFQTMEMARALSPEVKVAVVQSSPRKQRGARVSRRRKISHSTAKGKGR